MRFTKLRWFAGISAAFLSLACGTIQAAPPRYGGTLHVKLRAANVSLDPREWKPGSLSAGCARRLREVPAGTSDGVDARWFGKKLAI